MLAAWLAAASDVDTLAGSLLCCDFPVSRKLSIAYGQGWGADELEIGTVWISADIIDLRVSLKRHQRPHNQRERHRAWCTRPSYLV